MQNLNENQADAASVETCADRKDHTAELIEKLRLEVLDKFEKSEKRTDVDIEAISSSIEELSRFINELYLAIQAKPPLRFRDRFSIYVALLSLSLSIGPLLRRVYIAMCFFEDWCSVFLTLAFFSIELYLLF
jgi:hypothetical protein